MLVWCLNQFSKNCFTRVYGSSSEESEESASNEDEKSFKKKLEQEDSKTDVDTLWEELKKSESSSIQTTLAPNEERNLKATTSASETVSIESHKVLRPKNDNKNSLEDLLSTLSGKKKKLTTLEKTLSDWQNFKKKEGISEELKEHAKNGYLERQAFLERSDLREFEREREIRLKRVNLDKK